MRSAHWLFLLRLCCVVALAASAALFVDYATLNPAFCTAADSGCGAVRHSGYGYLPIGPGIPVPDVGLAGFGMLLLASLFGSLAQRRVMLLALAGVGGLAGSIFILLQALKIGRFCEFCLVADTSSIVAVVAAVMFWVKSAGQEETGRPDLAPWAWVVLGALAVAAPLAWPRLRPRPPVPPAIAALYKPGKINVVEFADFECPYCRMLHPQLQKLFAAYAGQVNFVRLNMPLSQHLHAHDAARAYVCAEAQGKGDVMANALFEAEELTPSATRRLAVGFGVDVDRYDHCIVDPATDAHIDAEQKILHDAGFEGLPTTWVGNQQIIGAQPEDVFRKAFDQAAAGDGGVGIPGPIYAIAAALLALGVAFAGRKRAGAGTNPAS